MNPYHAIIQRKLRQAFQQLGSGDYVSLLKDINPQFEHAFLGGHTLGGTRHTLASYERWFERLFRIFPDLRFEIRNIVVSGWPWDTVAAVEWIDRATPADGVPYVNEGVHIMRLRWGRVVSIRVYLDTQLLDDTCRRLAAHGVEEARAPQIVD